MSKSKGGREVRKPKQAKQSKDVKAAEPSVGSKERPVKARGSR